ncbi:uncharacterized protein RCO7_03989 [Rhynchosporium graminicola]|uniref:Secreted protein n=1 Tax=Rhynchosporium graminicola TaxID=2792576 RepID=A0A1E1LQ16_9HELO|nr:uncharacterized protein RCO7_03989 [Rhynchosporium commune]
MHSAPFFFCLFALEPFGRSEDVSTIFSSSSTAFLIMTSSGVKKDWARFTYTFLSESSFTRRPFGGEWSKLEVVVWNGTYSGSICDFFASSFPEGLWLAAFDTFDFVDRAEPRIKHYLVAARRISLPV